MAAERTTTLRKFINALEELSENGKYDNLRVVTLNSDDEYYDIGWYGIETIYPQDEVEDNPQNGEKCFVIQI